MVKVKFLETQTRSKSCTFCGHFFLYSGEATLVPWLFGAVVLGYQDGTPIYARDASGQIVQRPIRYVDLCRTCVSNLPERDRARALV